MARPIERKVGDVLRIPLTDGDHAYGFELAHRVVVVVDFKGSAELAPEVVVRTAPLFKVMVMDSAVEAGRWPVVGHVELSKEWLQPVKYFRQDSEHWERLFIHLSDGTETPTDVAGIEGLEAAALWEPGHVEDRIMDHYAGRENLWMKSIAHKSY